MNKLVLEKSFYFLFTYFLLSCSSKSDPGDGVPPPPPPPPVTYEWVFGSTPVWTDEFSTDGAPDASKWGYDIGGNGWGNNELQYYTDGLNASINGGILKITAKKESYSGGNFFHKVAEVSIEVIISVHISFPKDA